jgi:peptidoglycan hydrolase-like protein with peptidoglycan-binding domain
MKRIILAMIAASSLALPALAQQDQSTPPQPSPSAISSQTQANEISPEKLKSAQIHQLQQALNDKGFNVGAVDGEWGPRTEDALKKFQGSNNIPSSGQLNAKAVTALGLNSSDFGLTGGSQTTGQAPAGTNNQQPSNSERNKGSNPAPAH